MRWFSVDAETDKQYVPLVGRWRSCSDTPAIDQVEAARALGLLEELNRPPAPSSVSFGVAIR
jgi:hypothetical protein